MSFLIFLGTFGSSLRRTLRLSVFLIMLSFFMSASLLLPSLPLFFALSCVPHVITLKGEIFGLRCSKSSLKVILGLSGATLMSSGIPLSVLAPMVGVFSPWRSSTPLSTLVLRTPHLLGPTEPLGSALIECLSLRDGATSFTP